MESLVCFGLSEARVKCGWEGACMVRHPACDVSDKLLEWYPGVGAASRLLYA